MATLSRAELYALFKGAGFTGHNLDVAVAVALAESGGDTNAHNGDASTGDDSYGVMQINMIGSLGPDRRKRFHLKSNADLFDSATNARVAYAIWKEQGWHPWTTYTSGKYKEHMTTSGDTSTPPPKDAGLFGVGAAINSFGETFLKGFASFGAVIVAVVLLVLGIVILLRNQVTAVVPGGKIAKAAKIAKAVSK